MTQSHLKDLATVIGWHKVNDDKDFTVYEYNKFVGKNERISHIIKIANQPTELEVYEVLLSLKSVLPRKLQRKVDKIIRNVKIENLPQVVDVVSFAVEEFKQKTMYTKLKQYGEIVGADIEKMGYEFNYEVLHKQQAEIISKIESFLPMELAPIVGKIRKIDYKINFVKNRKNIDMIKESE